MLAISVFSPDGTNHAPDSGTILNGYDPGYALPASNINYYLNGLTLLNQEAENLLAAASITPNAAVTNQILQSINILIGNAVIAQSWKAPVVVATTANITLSGEQTIDGVLTSASRVLVKNQADPKQNGLYVSAAGAWARASDAATGPEIVAATMIVEEGTVGAQTQWTNTNTSITLGTTSITFVKTPALLYSAGTGLTLTGNVFSLTAPVSLANGGTGQTTASAAFNALSPMTTLGDSLYGGASGAATRLAGNITSTRKFWSQTGTGSVSAAPTIDVLLTGDIPSQLDGARLFTGVVTIASTGGGIFQFETNTADANLNTVGAIDFIDKNNANTDKRIAYINATLNGSHANDRGGQINIGLRGDNQTTAQDIINIIPGIYPAVEMEWFDLNNGSVVSWLWDGTSGDFSFGNSDGGGDLMITGGSRLLLGGATDIVFGSGGNTPTVTISGSNGDVIIDPSNGGYLQIDGTSSHTLKLTNAASAPSASTIVLPTSVFGTSSHLLANPATWMLVHIAGSDYKIPAYS